MHKAKTGTLALWCLTMSLLLREETVVCFVGKPLVLAKDKRGCRPFHKHRIGMTESDKNDINDDQTSKTEMLRFAVPALGIYLANPLMSNIDNGFVGRTSGTEALAAMSPATLCTDQMLYLFSFLGRATTGIVARAYSAQKDGQGDVEAARKAASAPFTVSLLCGLGVSLFYAFFTPAMLSLLRVDAHLRQSAASYIYWRAIVAPAAIAQSICLSIMLVTRDSIRPLKVVSLAAFLNVIFDALLCAWPFKWGCAGAAAATSFATIISFWFMMQSLREKSLLPKIITITRLGGFIAMQRTAMRLGLNALAGYQVCVNVMMFFLLFGEPLSQLSQTKLPTLLEKRDSRATLATLKSVLTLPGCTAVCIAAISFIALQFGTSTITSDMNVQSIAKSAANSMFIAVATSIFAVAVDGAQLAAKDFNFMLLLGLVTMFVQLQLLPYCLTVSSIFDTFTIRLGTYAVASIVRGLLGYGGIGCVIRKRPWIAKLKNVKQ